MGSVKCISKHALCPPLYLASCRSVSSHDLVFVEEGFRSSTSGGMYTLSASLLTFFTFIACERSLRA